MIGRVIATCVVVVVRIVVVEVVVVAPAVVVVFVVAVVFLVAPVVVLQLVRLSRHLPVHQNNAFGRHFHAAFHPIESSGALKAFRCPDW